MKRGKYYKKCWDKIFGTSEDWEIIFTLDFGHLKKVFIDIWTCRISTICMYKDEGWREGNSISKMAYLNK